MLALMEKNTLLPLESLAARSHYEGIYATAEKKKKLINTPITNLKTS